MPMPYKEFNWRPNDNSATTNLRYSLEAEKWVNAVSSAQRKARPRSVSADFAFVGMLLELVFSVLLLVLLGILELVKALVYLVEVNVREKGGPSSKDRSKKSPLKLTANFEKPNVLVWDLSNEQEKYVVDHQKKNIKPNPLIYDTYGEPWALWKIFFRFIFIFICIYVVMGIISHIFSPDFDMANPGFLYFSGAVSIYFAIVEGD